MIDLFGLVDGLLADRDSLWGFFLEDKYLVGLGGVFCVVWWLVDQDSQ